MLGYLKEVDPGREPRARHHYSCFDHFGRSIADLRLGRWLRDGADLRGGGGHELIALRRKAMDYLQRDGQVAADAYFCAEQNALVVRDAEQYYRTMFRRRSFSWNLRDTHMMDSLVRWPIISSKQRVAGQDRRLGAQLPPRRRPGDADERARRAESRPARARALRTEAVLDRLHDLQRHVTAASDWDGAGRAQTGPARHPRQLRGAVPRGDTPRFWLDLRDMPRSPRSCATAAGARHRRHLPARNRTLQPLFPARLPDQFDAVLHFDHTRAVEPLERTPNGNSAKWRKPFRAAFERPILWAKNMPREATYDQRPNLGRDHDPDRLRCPAAELCCGRGRKSGKRFMHQTDFEKLMARFEDPARAKWQKPEKVIASLGPLDGKTVADIGAGTGYFSFPISKQAAKVIAIDIDQRFLDYIEQKKQTQKIDDNIETRLTKPDSSGLKPREADMVLIVDTYHHINDESNTLRTQKVSAQRRRACDHRLQEGEDAAGPPVELRLAEDR